MGSDRKEEKKENIIQKLLSGGGEAKKGIKSIYNKGNLFSKRY